MKHCRKDIHQFKSIYFCVVVHHFPQKAYTIFIKEIKLAYLSLSKMLIMALQIRTKTPPLKNKISKWPKH